MNDNNHIDPHAEGRTISDDDAKAIASALVDNLSLGITITGTGARFSRSGTLTEAAAFARGLLFAGITNGAVIDGTIRLYMPQLEQGADGSAPIATSAGAVTRTADVSNADKSLVEWVMSL